MSDEEQGAAPVVFHGKATEYFGIWIVNVLLTVLTFGIYSAWAKVRTNRYFYGSTELEGEAFSYAASPVKILLARLLVIGVLVGAQLATAAFPPLGILFAIGFVFLFPWLVTRALRFRARVSRWRQVPFDFETSYWPAFVTLYFVPLITVFSAGLLAPVATKLTQEWAYNRFRFGGRPFALSVRLLPLYLLLGLMILAFAVVFGGVGALFAAFGAMGAETTLEPSGAVGIIWSAALALAVLALVYEAGVRNIVFDGLVLDGRHRFRSTLSKSRYAFIVITNALVVAVTLGLMIPWARIRLARYLASATHVLPGGPLADYVAEIKENEGVVGEEFLDLEDIDVGIGL